MIAWPQEHVDQTPNRADLLAAQELADVRRVLAIELTPRTISSSHEWVMRAGEVPIRLEIADGAELEEVEDLMGRLAPVMRAHWSYLIDPIGARAVAQAYERVDLSRGTIDGVLAVDERAFKPRRANEIELLRQEMASLKADNAKLAAAVLAAHRELILLTVGRPGEQEQTENRPRADAGSNGL